MISGVSIILVGLPEKVQRVADALDQVLPGGVVWRDIAEAGDNDVITLTGVSVPLLDGMPQDDAVKPKLVRSTTSNVPKVPPPSLT